MPQLRLDDLSVASFVATPNEPFAGVTNTRVDTQQVECWSPLCGPTAARTCECETTVTPPVINEPAVPTIPDAPAPPSLP